MRILWFTNTPSMAEDIVGEKATSGGWIKSLEKQLKKRNIELGVAFYANGKNQKVSHNGAVYYIIKKRTKNKFLKVLYRHLNVFESKKDIDRYIEIINDFNPDIIHIHGTENTFGTIIEKTNIPVVVSIQGITTVISHKTNRFINKKRINFQFLGNVLFARSNRIRVRTYEYKKKVEIRTFTSLEYIIGRTEWDRNVTRVLAPKSKYFCSNEILRDSFYKHEWKNNLKSRLIIHTTASSSILKGIDTIFKAASILEHLNIDFVWNIAGIAQNDWRIKSIVGSDKISSKINFLGILDETEMINKLLEAHLYVMASHIENSSNALSEAMLLGMPCIATFVGGTNTLINHEHDGVLVPDDDPWALSGKIYQLYNDFKIAIDMGVNARKIAIKRHDPDLIASHLISDYNQMIETNT